MDIHQALNWRAIWPVLSTLPAAEPLSILDAGCGDGAWCRRIARLRPRWRIVGMDRDAARLRAGTRIEQTEPLGNVRYVEGSFLTEIPGRFDVILSVASIHYAAAEGDGELALRHLAGALAPGGRLILLVPRCDVEQPVWRALPRPRGWSVFTPAGAEALVRGAGLQVRSVEGLYGSWCVLGKQLAMWAGGSAVRRVVSLPLQGLIRATAFDLLRDGGRPSYALRLVAEIP